MLGACKTETRTKEGCIANSLRASPPQKMETKIYRLQGRLNRPHSQLFPILSLSRNFPGRHASFEKAEENERKRKTPFAPFITSFASGRDENRCTLFRSVHLSVRSSALPPHERSTLRPTWRPFFGLRAESGAQRRPAVPLLRSADCVTRTCSGLEAADDSGAEAASERAGE